MVISFLKEIVVDSNLLPQEDNQKDLAHYKSMNSIADNLISQPTGPSIMKTNLVRTKIEYHKKSM